MTTEKSVVFKDIPDSWSYNLLNGKLEFINSGNIDIRFNGVRVGFYSIYAREFIIFNWQSRWTKDPSQKNISFTEMVDMAVSLFAESKEDQDVRESI